MPDSWDYSNKRPEANPTEYSPPILTRFMVVLSIVFTLAFHTGNMAKDSWWDTMGKFGAVDSDVIWNGRVYALVTSVFVHGTPGNFTGTLMHIGFNMMWLLTLGTILEATLHPLRWLLFFVSSAVIASGAELAVSSHTGIGMSGVVYAMFGLMWAGRRQFPEWRLVATRNNLNLFIGWGLLCLVGTLSGVLAIANAAHGGGFLFGLAVGWLFIEKKYRWLGGACVAVLTVIMVLSVTWMPWSGSWCFWKATREYDRNNYAAAARWWRQSIRFGEDRETALWNIALAERQRGNEAGAAAAERERDQLAIQPAPREEPPPRETQDDPLGLRRR